MEVDKLEERIKKGERFFIIYSNDLKQVYINLDNHDENYTKCIPHLEINKYTKPFNAPRPFPILIEYTDDFEFRFVTTKDKLNILNNEELSYLTTIQVEKPLNIYEAFSYVKQAVKLLKESPLAIDIASIKPLDDFTIWEMEEILKNKDLSKNQIKLLEEKKQYLINLYERTYNNYKTIIKQGHERIKEKHLAATKAKLHREKIKNDFNEFIEKLYMEKPKVKTLKKSN